MEGATIQTTEEAATDARLKAVHTAMEAHLTGEATDTPAAGRQAEATAVQTEATVTHQRDAAMEIPREEAMEGAIIQTAEEAATDDHPMSVHTVTEAHPREEASAAARDAASVLQEEGHHSASPTGRQEEELSAAAARVEAMPTQEEGLSADMTMQGKASREESRQEEAHRQPEGLRLNLIRTSSARLTSRT